MRRKLKQCDLASLASRMKVVEPDYLDGFLGCGSGSASDPYTCWEFLAKDFSDWEGGYVSGLIDKNGKLYYVGGTALLYIEKENNYMGATQPAKVYTYVSGSELRQNECYDSNYVQQIVKSLPQNQQKYYQSLVDRGLLKGVSFGELKSSANISIDQKDGTLAISLDTDSGIVLQPYQYGSLLTQELFHYFQYEKNIMSYVDSNHSPIEYQENLMRWMQSGNCEGFLGEQSKDFDNWLKQVVDKKEVNLNKFLEGVSQWYESFIDNHTGKYAEDKNYKYKEKIEGMNWDEVFKWFGYTVK